MDAIHQIEALAPLVQSADHIDVKTVEGEAEFREYLSRFFAYQPRWVTFLYHVRRVFVRFLGMKQEGIPQADYILPAAFPMTAGEKIAIFTVRAAEEDQYWFGEIAESHLSAILGVVVEPLDGQRKRFHVATFVYYRHWTGKIYFNIIRPFHHLVVAKMAQAGLG